jgi:D-alanyl-D-alanine carboxypeptidase/D-alanyl-D-alanine-endopeptidase (penicillin-binding protein 4)
MLLRTLSFIFLFLNLTDLLQGLPQEMLKIMQQSKYQHANWGITAIDSETGQTLFDLNADQLFLPASTTKLFSVAALLHAYGDDYRFKTPVYAVGNIQEGQLEGNLILVGQGDLTLGGRQEGPDKIAFTKLDHIIANEVPGVILTKEDPLNALKELAKQIHEKKGITTINGNVLIDDRLFETIQKRGLMLSPILINENLIDIVISPTGVNQPANLEWRPKVEGYSVTNEVQTISKGDLNIEISSDEWGKKILVKGSIPLDQKDVVRTFAVKNPQEFARAAFIQALKEQGVTVNLVESSQLPSEASLQNMQPIAVWTSPPLSEYAKLILKVSHNLGADLVPLLLAVRNNEKTFVQGMRLLGNFIIQEVKISPDAFVFIDGAGGDENRLTPKAEIQLLEYMRKQPSLFRNFFNALPILGVDGSLADFGKTSHVVGKVHAKTGTGVSYNLATAKLFLTTQTLAGYIEGKNGHLIEFMISVNNGIMPEIKDIFPIFEDLSQISSIIYDSSGTEQLSP